MQKAFAKEKVSLLQGKKMVFFGYGRHDAARNMAIDEAMFMDSKETGNCWLRFYDFDRPSIILAISDHPDSLNTANLESIGVSRRKSGGDPIYLDDTDTFSYSFSGRFDSDLPFNYEFKEFVHEHLGRMVADSIKTVVEEDCKVDIGKHNSIRLNGMPIAGNAQRIEGKYSFLYQGVLAVGGWNPDKIRSVLRICDEDYESLGYLPSVDRFAKVKNMGPDYYKE